MRKKILALVLAVAMIIGTMPISVEAADCEHHFEHTEDCGYVEAKEGAVCTHEHDEECYVEGTCLHAEHDEFCEYVEATEETEGKECNHVCEEECKAKVEACGHEHDETCGFVEAVEGVGCSFVCEICEVGKDDTDNNTEPAECTETEECEAVVHKDTCPKYVWACDKSEACKATDHEEDCAAAIKAEVQKTFDEMLANLPAPESIDPLDEEQLETVHNQIVDIITFALENDLYEMQDEVTSHPTISAVLDAMYPKTTPEENEIVEDGAYILDYSWYDASKTTFEISTVGQLAAFAKITQGKAEYKDKTKIAKDNFSSKTVTLTADLIFREDQYWYYNDGSIEVNYCIKDFAGTFDGNDKTIKNLKFSNTNKAENDNGTSKVNPVVGLFEAISGKVESLTLDTITANLNSRDTFGFIARNLSGTAIDCHVKGVVVTIETETYGTGYTSSSGGMFGSISSATVTNCTAENVKLTCYGSDNTDNVGALIGYASGSEGNRSTISNCSVKDVTFDCTRKTKRTGGFVGNTNWTDVSDCTAENVNISVDTYYQGIGGFVGQPSNSTYTNCKVIGFNMSCGSSATIAGNVGGFAGTCGDKVKFIRCSVTELDMDLISDNNGFANGGFIGKQSGSNVVLDDCSATGEITVTGEGNVPVGGLIGVSNASAVEIKNSTSVTDITTNGIVGGLVGTSKGGTITDCTVIGDISSTNGTAGDLVGSVAEGANVEIPADSTVTTANGIVVGGPAKVNEEGKIVVEKGGSITEGNFTVVVTGDSAIVDHGNTYVEENDKIKVGNKEFTVTSGSAIVKQNGTAEIPAGTTVKTEDGIIITGPATINSDGSVSVAAGGSITKGNQTVSGPAYISPDGKITIIRDVPSKGKEYKYLEGQRQTIVLGDEATFRIDGEYKDFVKVKVDGETISSDKYKSQEGSTIITLRSSYTRTLSEGDHELTVVFTDGQATTKFTVISEAVYLASVTPVQRTGGVPATGDDSNTVLWTVLMLSCAVVVAASIKISKRKNRL